MPTLKKSCYKILSLLPTNIKEGMIYELGSGWGGMAALLSKKYTNYQVKGYEISWVPFLFSKICGCMHSRVFFKCKNFFTISHQDATLIYCYLYPGAMSKLKEKWEKELFPGTWVISYTFAIPGWNPDFIYQADDLYRSNIYMYQVKDF